MRGRPRGCTGRERPLRRSPRGPRACRDDPRTAILARVNRDRQGNRCGLLSPSRPCRWPAKCRRFAHPREFWTCSTRRARIGKSTRAAQYCRERRRVYSPHVASSAHRSSNSAVPRHALASSSWAISKEPFVKRERLVDVRAGAERLRRAGARSRQRQRAAGLRAAHRRRHRPGRRRIRGPLARARRARARAARGAADGHAGRARHLDAQHHQGHPRRRRCRWPPSSRRRAHARPAPAPTSCTPRTSRRWRRPPTSAPRRRSPSACRSPGGSRSRRAGAASAASAADAGHDTLAAKRINDATAYIRSLAQLRGRDVAWAEQAVREAVSLSAQRRAGAQGDRPRRRRRRPTCCASSTAAWCRSATRSGGTRDAGHRARRASSTLEPDWRGRLLAVISDPSLALVLMMIGIYGLLFEFMNPGFVAPGVIGGVCLLLALWGLQMLPVNYAGLAPDPAGHRLLRRRGLRAELRRARASAASPRSSSARCC